MRGFVITLLAVSLVLILVMLSMSLSDTQLSTDRAIKDPLPLMYGAFLLDDVGHNLNSIVGPGMVFSETNSSTGISVADTLSGYNYTPAIVGYGAFLSDEIAPQTASSITTNLTNLTNGVTSLNMDGNYAYSNDHNQNVSIFTKAGGTGASAYFINATVTAVRTNVTPMAFTNGTMNVTIDITDINGTYMQSGSVSPDQQNTLVLYYSGASLTITVGPQGGNSGSLLMQALGTNAAVSWAAILPPLNSSDRIGYAYNATIDYAQGAVEKRCAIGE